MKVLLTLMIILITNGKIFSQQFRPDNRIQVSKEDASNFYKSDLITNLDMIQALELVGISIYKFDLGTFDKTYQLQIILEEFKDGKKVKSDILFEGDNTYHYFTRGEKDSFKSYIDKIKIFSQLKEDVLNLNFSTYGQSFKREIQIKKYNKDSFYNLRSYVDSKCILNERIPLLVYASSWKNENTVSQRFCGVVNLSRNDEETNELLNSSPHYYMISYIVKE